MNKILFVIALLICAAFNSIAQRSNTFPQISIGAEFGQPASKTSDTYGTVAGLSVKAEIPVLAPGLSVTATAGISAFLLRFYYTGPEHNATYVPLELGAKYYFSKVAYVEGDAGVSLNQNSNYPASKAAIILSPVIGVTAPTNHHKHSIDLGLRAEHRLESHRDITQIAVRVAYRFKI